MVKGTVKWFNSQKGYASSRKMEATTFLYISPQFKLTALKNWKKANASNSKFKRETKDLKLRM